MRMLCAVLLMMVAALAHADSAYTPVLGAFLTSDHLAMAQHGINPSSDSSTSLGFGLALDGGGQERLSLEYADFDLGDSRQLQLLDVNADYFCTSGSLPPALRPFAGLALGYGRLDFPAEAGLSGDRNEHLAYGARVGAVWNFAPQLALELGGRYLQTSLATHPGGSAEFAVRADASLWLGLEYRLR